MRPACDPELIAFANRLADAGGEVIRRFFRRPIEVDRKIDESPVTVADREAERAMRTLIEAAFPDHGIVGEEFGETRAGAELVWVLDPIDGTRSFIAGQPLFGTLIALVRDGTPVLGVIDAPIMGERWIGAAGRPSTLNEAPIRVRPCPNLEHAVLYAPAHECFAGADRDAFVRLRESAAMTM